MIFFDITDRVKLVRYPVMPMRVQRECSIDAAGCVNCGSKQFAARQIISDDLAASWGLSDQERRWFDEREGNHCIACGMTLRVRMLLWTLRRIVPVLAGVQVLHINHINHLINHINHHINHLINLAIHQQEKACKWEWILPYLH